MNQMVRVAIVALAVGALAGAQPADGAEISECFNDYGTSLVAITPSFLPSTAGNLNGGTGWAGPWQCQNYGAITDYEDYLPGSNLTSSVTGYANTGNESDSDDGSAKDLGGGSRLDRASFRPTGGLSGTVWISFLWQSDDTFDNTDVNLFLDSTVGNGGSNSINLGRLINSSNPGVRLVYDGSETSSGESTATSGSNLAIIRVVLDHTGSQDSVELWSTPSDVSTIAAMGSADLTGDGNDVFGTSLDYVGFAISGEADLPRFDALRISNDANGGFTFVTTGVVPEPATMALLALGGLALIRRRRQA